jgi:RNA polymerase sigma-70 factor (ECF subfamily)
MPPNRTHSRSGRDSSAEGTVGAFLQHWCDNNIAAMRRRLRADALLVADGADITTPPTREIVGADFVLASLAHLRDALAVDALGAASVNATPGIVMRADGRVVAVLVFNVVEGLISRVWVIANPARLTRWNQGEDDS